MKHSTITQLNRLNHTFYQIVGESFDSTRQSFWPGWNNQLYTYLTKHFLPQKSPLQSIKVLDIGCGNGRFGQFLAEGFPERQWAYTGIDSSQLLLDKALNKLRNLPNLSSHFLVTDIVENNLPDQLNEFDLIVSFGVLHHLPSAETRQTFFDRVAAKIKTDGLLVVSCWQFLNDPKLSQRITDPAIVKIDPTELEPGDYILDWRAGEIAYRYCHQYSDQELASLTANWRLQETFSADGHSGQLNRYLLLTPTGIESSP